LLKNAYDDPSPNRGIAVVVVVVVVVEASATVVMVLSTLAGRRANVKTTGSGVTKAL
jgi:hypothetical protein